MTGRSEVVARYRSYHGSTAASISVTGELRRKPIERVQKVPGTVFAPDCYCYRCPFGLTYPSCGVACAEYVDYQLEREGDVAAMILELVVGTNGVIVPVPEYLPRIREITKKHDVLLIADEVMSGWGRVGEWFAVDHWQVTPDILTTAKGITGAQIPLGLTTTTAQVHDTFRETYFPHGHTYEAHPLTLAPGVAAIEEYPSPGADREVPEGRGISPLAPEGGRRPAPLGRGGAGPRALRRRRTRQEPDDPGAVQQRGGQARRPPSSSTR